MRNNSHQRGKKFLTNDQFSSIKQTIIQPLRQILPKESPYGSRKIKQYT